MLIENKIFEELMTQLNQSQIEIWQEDGQLWLKSAVGSLNNPLLTEIKEKAEILLKEPDHLSYLDKYQFKLDKHNILKHSKDHKVIGLAFKEQDQEWTSSYLERRSYRKFKTEKIPFDTFSYFLSSLQLVKMEDVLFLKGTYGSAGGLYPVQVYLYIKPDRVEDLAPGIYYYHPLDHTLILINERTIVEKEHYTPGNALIFEEAAFVVYFIGKMNAISPLYGIKGRDYALMEVGLICQMLEMTAPQFKLGFCQIGGFDFTPLQSAFSLEKDQVYLHQMTGGMIHPDQTSLVSLQESSQSMQFLMDQLKIKTLLEKLNQEHIILSVYEGQLRFKAPKGALSPELKEEISQYKEELIQIFSAR